tara:strand:- start:2442 stop:3023 length:582 start_codon:yes stop_codon:yes gene_type:complete
MPTVGVLAIQGDFHEHKEALLRLGVNSREIRVRSHLSGIDGLIIPGGESTTIVQLIDKFQLRDTLIDEVNSGLPVWGTCAGMIVLANRLTESRPSPLNLMDIEVSRNAFGRQIHSFELDIDIAGVQGPPFPAIFIRAPIVKNCGAMVKILASIENGFPVAVRQGHILATSFHPELTNDDRIHRLFMDIVEGSG